MFKRGDKIRENRQGSKTETVLDAYGNIIETYEGRGYHITKVVKA